MNKKKFVSWLIGMNFPKSKNKDSRDFYGRVEWEIEKEIKQKHTIDWEHNDTGKKEAQWLPQQVLVHFFVFQLISNPTSYHLTYKETMTCRRHKANK